MLDAYADYAAPSFDNRINDIMMHMDNSNSTELLIKYKTLYIM